MPDETQDDSPEIIVTGGRAKTEVSFTAGGFPTGGGSLYGSHDSFHAFAGDGQGPEIIVTAPPKQTQVPQWIVDWTIQFYQELDQRLTEDPNVGDVWEALSDPNAEPLTDLQAQMADFVLVEGFRQSLTEGRYDEFYTRQAETYEVYRITAEENFDALFRQHAEIF